MQLMRKEAHLLLHPIIKETIPDSKVLELLKLQQQLNSPQKRRASQKDEQKSSQEQKRSTLLRKGEVGLIGPSALTQKHEKKVERALKPDTRLRRWNLLLETMKKR